MIIMFSNSIRVFGLFQHLTVISLFLQRMQDPPFRVRSLFQELAENPHRSMLLVRMARCFLIAVEYMATVI